MRRALTGLLIAAALAASTGVTLAAFSGQTANPSNSFDAAASFPRCYSNAMLADSPVGYWRLGETSGTTAADATGANAGTYQNAPTLGQPGALTETGNKAVGFDGTDDAVSIADSTSLDVGDVFTYEAWIKRGTTASGTYAIFGKGTGAPSLRIDSANKLTLTKLGTGDVASSATTIADTSAWHHVAVTKNGATVKLYIDGIDVTGTVTNAAMTNNTTAQSIGQSGSGSNYFNGQIDEAAIYNAALGATRIKTHYKAGRCYRDEIDVDDPVAHWRLGEASGPVAFDSEATHHGIYNNGVTLGAASAVVNNDSNTAGSFDGANDRVKVPDQAALRLTGNFSIEAWISPDVVTAGRVQYVLAKGTTYYLYLHGSDVYFGTRRDGAYGFVKATNAVTAGSWQHFVGTWDGSTMRLYKNGVQVVSQAFPSGVNDADTSDLVIGAGIGADYLDGTLDEVALYSTALSATRVQANYVAGRAYRDAVLDSGPAGYWRLGEASGTTATDQAGANNGSYTGGPALGEASALSADADTSVRFNANGASTMWVTVPYSSSLDVGDVFTYEAWIKRGTTATGGDVFGKGTGGAELRIDTANKLLLVKGGGGGGTVATSTTAIADTTTWHHVAATKNGATVKLYIDGADVTGTVSNKVMENNTSPLYIGARDPSTQTFEGWIDEPAIYKVALTADQIQLHYKAGR